MQTFPVLTRPTPVATSQFRVLILHRNRSACKRKHHLLWHSGSVALLLFILLKTGPALAQQQTDRENQGIQTVLTSSESTSGVYRFRGLDLHPDLLFQPYTSGQILGESTSPAARRLAAFRDLLALYEQRQGIDDNFTIRVTDNRSGDLLELFELKAERATYEREGAANWKAIDDKRRIEMRRLLDKYAGRGIPRSAITVRWGRADQVHEARRSELPYIRYEVRLARYLGLSLLATEIGTVETFNQDRLVSSAGARSRYQMMPYVLRQNAIQRYQLRTASGSSVSVTEEWHPLLTMEPAFFTLKGYINSVGHEIPGISSYHTGPGNIFKIYELFLSQGSGLVSPSSTVIDAYVWGVTDGFDTVSQRSTFKQYSRAYIPSVYGSLRAVEDLPVDDRETTLAERVQLKAGKRIFLSQLLRLFENQESRLTWGADTEEVSLYERFRQLNPHIALPNPAGDGVPVRGDVGLVAQVRGTPVRFFLPLGASEVLADQNMDILDEEATFRFDYDTYTEPAEGEKTKWDQEYDALVQEIARFGFTQENQSKLSALRTRFEQLAAANPSHYRRAQLQIITTHDRIWKSGPWESLASARKAAARKLQPR